MEASPAFHDRAGAMRRQEPFRTDRPCAPGFKIDRVLARKRRGAAFSTKSITDLLGQS
jgi:hypothetical protein